MFTDGRRAFVVRATLAGGVVRSARGASGRACEGLCVDFCKTPTDDLGTDCERLAVKFHGGRCSLNGFASLTETGGLAGRERTGLRAPKARELRKSGKGNGKKRSLCIDKASKKIQIEGVKPFYITTAIDYANGDPHLGHSYEKVLADVIARTQRLRGLPVHYLTGLDEHGQKVEQSARAKNVEPLAFCDGVAEKFKALCEALGISNNDFIRTTEPRHQTFVARVLEQLNQQGDIYKAEYSGAYSPRQEQFLQEKDKVQGAWPEIFGEVIEVNEPAYFFKLSKYQDWLIEHIQTHPNFIEPQFRAKQILEALKEPLKDLCISRPIERLSWGIPLPFDPEFVCYVWLDALSNYLSAIGGADDPRWPADLHIIGKDILVPAHGVYWPALLKALNLPQPKRILVHGWWNLKGKKMSKSQGMVVDPFALIETFGADALRYFFMREMRIGQDSDFSYEQLLKRYESELANDLGNLLNRTLNMLKRYIDPTESPEVQVTEAPEMQLAAQWKTLRSEVLENFANFDYQKGLIKLFGFISELNGYLETRAPWKLAKSKTPEDRQRLKSTLACTAEGLRLSSLLLTPIMPQTAERIHAMLGLQVPKSWTEGTQNPQNQSKILDWKPKIPSKPSTQAIILFPRIENDAAITDDDNAAAPH